MMEILRQLVRTNWDSEAVGSDCRMFLFELYYDPVCVSFSCNEKRHSQFNRNTTATVVNMMKMMDRKMTDQEVNSCQTSLLI